MDLELWCSVVRCCGAVGGVSGFGSRAASWKRTGRAKAQPIPRDREDRLFEALERLRGEPPGRPRRQRGLRALAGDGA